MSTSSGSFGRRRPAGAPPRGASPRSGRPHEDPLALSPEAEAFRAALPRRRNAQAELEAATGGAGSLRLIVWGVRLTLCAPGAAAFALHAPMPVGLALEALGLVSGVWIRDDRRRRLRAIAACSPPDEAA